MMINGATEVYGIMGEPVAHSLSPVMHNAAFEHLKLNKVYVPFPVHDAAAGIAAMRAMGICGLSVTIPHKQSVLPYLDDIEAVAARIGAVNTLATDETGIRGHNTDWLGANRALEEKLSLAGCPVLILGAGGAARAIGFGLLEAGASVKLASRTPEKGRKLADDLGCAWDSLAVLPEIEAEVLINATSVGMAPRVDESPVAASGLGRFTVVMDIVYAPLRTRLLREAAAAGCRVIDGLAMLLYQGAAQFELWTGRPAPVEVMRRALQDTLRGGGS